MDLYTNVDYATDFALCPISSVVFHEGMSIATGFFGCTTLTDVTIADSIKTIGDGAFRGCTSMKEIRLPSNLQVIESNAFSNTGLEKIEIPDGVTQISVHAFSYCPNLRSVKFHDGITVIDMCAFENCPNLSTIVMPKNLKTIKSEAFNQCESLSKIFFTGSAPTIEDRAFYGICAIAYYPENDSSWENIYQEQEKFGAKELDWKEYMPIRIITQPVSVKAHEGETVKVTVKASGDDLAYTWYIKNAEATKFSKSSVTKSTYSVTMSSKTNGRQVYCVITDKYGNEVKSDVVTLNMAKTLKITEEPKGVAVANKKTAKVTVKAEGEGLKYTWYVKDVGKTKFTKSSITKSSYSVTMTAARSGRQVYCVVSDKNGNEVVSNTVTISRITITKQPKGDVGKSNERVSATVKATGDGIKYQWYVKDAGKTKFTKSSITKATYGYKMTTAKSGRQAYCVITDKYGNSVTTNTITFSRLYIKTQPKSVKVASGTSAKVTVKVVGEDLTYTWYVKDPGKSAFTKSSITKSSYSVKMTSARNGRQVYCVITDAYGNTVRTETVTLRMK